MTIITCGGCKGQFSDTQAFCPGCGHPTPGGASGIEYEGETVNLSGEEPWPAWPEEESDEG